MTLDTLAKKVTLEHTKCLKAMRSVLAHARAAGEALLKAKAELEHGSYEPWVRGCGLSTVTAWRYARIAKGWTNLSSVKDLDTLTINAALEILTASESSSSGGGAASWAVSGEWQDHLPLKSIHREFSDFLRQEEWRHYDDANRAALLRELARVEALISKIKTELSGKRGVEKAA